MVSCKSDRIYWNAIYFSRTLKGVSVECIVLGRQDATCECCFHKTLQKLQAHHVPWVPAAVPVAVKSVSPA